MAIDWAFFDDADETIYSEEGRGPSTYGHYQVEHITVDKGYQGQDHPNQFKVCKSGQKRDCCA